MASGEYLLRTTHEQNDFPPHLIVRRRRYSIQPDSSPKMFTSCFCPSILDLLRFPRTASDPAPLLLQSTTQTYRPFPGVESEYDTQLTTMQSGQKSWEASSVSSRSTSGEPSYERLVGAAPVPGTILGMGGSCFVSVYDDRTVLKGYEIWVKGKREYFFPSSCREAICREDIIYRRLGVHPRILRCFGLREVHPRVYSLRLELAPWGDVRRFIEAHANDPPPERVRLQMAVDIAAGLSYVHSQGIRHSDISCRNLFLFENYRVKIRDFGGSLMEGYAFTETVCEEPRYELPRRGRSFDGRPPMKTELFALGSAIYEVMAWEMPFPGLLDEHVLDLYARDEFPSLDGIAARDAIQNCWEEVYDTAEDVVASLRGCRLNN